MSAQLLLRHLIGPVLVVLPVGVVFAQSNTSPLPPAQIIPSRTSYRSAPPPVIQGSRPAAVDATTGRHVPSNPDGTGSEIQQVATDVPLAPPDPYLEPPIPLAPPAPAELPELPELPPAPDAQALDSSSESAMTPLVIPPGSEQTLEGGTESESKSDIDESGSGHNRIRWTIGGDDRIGAFVLEELGSLAPAPPNTFESMFGYTIQFLDGPTVTDLPPRLFGFHYGLQWREDLNSDWEYEVAVTPGIYSDFEDSAREGLRIQGRGLVRYQQSSDLQWVGGVQYLDRDTTKLLPIAGLIYTPTSRTQLELVFPRPAIRQMLKVSDGKQSWGTLYGSFEGDSFAIERLTGEADVVTLEEFKLAMRYETTHLGREFSYWELGYLFGRTLRYRSGLGDYDPGDTIMLSWGTHY